MQFFLFIYFFLFFCLIINHYYAIAIVSLLIFPVAFAIKNSLKKSRVKKFSKKIKNAHQLFIRNIEIEPFLNINTEHWTVIELIPGVSRVRAKTLSNRVKGNKIEKFNEFADIVNLEPELYPFVSAIIKFN